VVLTLVGGRTAVLLVRRAVPPFQDAWALPGGFVRADEDAEAAAVRELKEETGLSASRTHLEQLRTYSDPHRDPRMRVVSVAYLALVADVPAPSAGGDAAAAALVPVEDIIGRRRRPLAFDHRTILRDGVERARAKLEYTTLAPMFLDQPFTIAQLRGVYEAVWGAPVDPANFRRKVTAADGFLVATGEVGAVVGRGHRPPALYRSGPARELNPPFLRRFSLDAP
jgi:8-oxo-dGTP diphosphatase